MQYKFRLDKMHCAGCALALEQNINTIEGVEAKISFVTKVIEINISTDNPAETLTEVKVAIKKFDHMVEILPYEKQLDEGTLLKYERIFNCTRYLIAFLLLIFFGYIAGIVSKLVNDTYMAQIGQKWYVLFFYVLNFVMVSADVVMYVRNLRLDRMKRGEEK